MIRVDDPHAVKHISKSSNVAFIRSHHKCIARYDRNDRLMGGVFFTDFNYASVQIHVASFAPNWINKQLLWLVFDYPFNHLKVKKLIGLVPETNKAAQSFDIGLGFVLETTVKDVFPNGDMLVFGMYREQCRFLDMRPLPLDGGYIGQGLAVT